MGYKDKRYGVTWNSKRSSTPTTVWFNTPGARNGFIARLIRNKIVLTDSIFTHNKNVDEDEL